MKISLAFFVVFPVLSTSCNEPASPNQGQVMLYVAPPPITVWIPGGITLQIPSGDAGPDAEYTFTAVPGNNGPEIAVYTWWIDDVMEVDQEAQHFQLKTGGGRFKSDSYPAQYKIRVEAGWVDLDTGDVIGARASGKFTVTVSKGGAITLHMPSGIGKGANVEYIFTAEPNNIPKTAVYSWWIGGQELKLDDPWGEGEWRKMQRGEPYDTVGRHMIINSRQLITPPEFFQTDSEYTIGVTAEWLDNNNQKQSAGDSGLFTLTEPTRSLSE